jgi:hypothetical protein
MTLIDIDIIDIIIIDDIPLTLMPLLPLMTLRHIDITPLLRHIIDAADYAISHY